MTGEMSPLDHSGGPVPSDDLRASHEDRDRVVELLRVAAGDGRLTGDELDNRLEKALTARTYGELTALTRDLLARPEFTPAPAPATPKDLVRIECRSAFRVREGNWLVPRRMDVKIRSGSVTLDFTRAVVVERMLHIDVSVRSGRLKLITRPGITVDTDDVILRSGRVKVRAPWGGQVPERLRIQVSGSLRSGQLNASPPRRTFWQWLLRRPPTYPAA
jgi:hypothetical protein